MKIFIMLFISVFFSIYTHAEAGSYCREDSLITLDDIPDWILKNIHFPQEGYGYGVAGIEQLCVSASWDGKVFICSKLNTLNPAFEKEIIDVISKAPKCQFKGTQPKDIYKYMLIDFYEYIPENRQELVKRVTMHVPPRLANIHSGTFNSRDKFLEWIHTNIDIPSTLKCYADTISFQYDVAKNGKVTNISIIDYKSDVAKSALEHALKKSPKWKPAMVDGSIPMAVTLFDKIIVMTDNNGDLFPFTAFIDNVYCNNTSPDDSNMIVLNPEIKPKYKGKSNFLKDIMQGVIDDKKISINGSFIIEKDGTVSHIDIAQISDMNLDSILKKTIAHTEWTAATQGGNKVRTMYSFGINRKPLKLFRNYSYYDIFGKYFIVIQADPARTSYSFIQRDGSVHNYPFNSQGLFNNTAYYQGLMYYYKNTSRKSGNISKKYFDTLYRVYVKH